MCFEEMDIYELRRRLREGIPSAEMRNLFPLPLCATLTVKYYVDNRLAEGTVKEIDGIYKCVNLTESSKLQNQRLSSL